MKTVAVLAIGATCFAVWNGAVQPARAGATAAEPAAHAGAVAGLVRDLMPIARKLGLKQRQIEQALAGFVADQEVTALATAQPEHLKSTGEYVKMLVTAARIDGGRRQLIEHSAVFSAIEASYGVERATLAAIWGIETRFGAARGSRHVIRSLATLALSDQRRASYWRRELVHAIAILVRGDIGRDAMLGSWAGAMGHTQFMPSTFNSLAVDFDGDGRRDVWNSRADALASAANYLTRSGWLAGEPWGFEVVLREGFEYALAAPQTWRPAAFWHMQGVRRPDGLAWPAAGSDLQLLLPAGAHGPAFLVSANFKAVMRYNPSTKYALAVCLLADGLAGRSAVMAAWPEEAPLSRADREELQSRLSDRGYVTGGVDGIIGKLTRAAIRSYQNASGLPQDAYPSLDVLRRLRDDAEEASIRLD